MRTERLGFGLFQSPFEADVFATLTNRTELSSNSITFQSPFEADVFATRRVCLRLLGASDEFQSPFEADVFATRANAYARSSAGNHGVSIPFRG